MTQLFKNNATSPLASSITSGATSLSLVSGSGALFPDTTGGHTFVITVTSADGTVQEIMLVTARATDDLTVTRAQEGTSAEPFTAGAVVEVRLTAKWFTDNATALALKAPLASPTFTGTVTIPDDAYDATGWNGNLTVPTKNAVRDKIEALVAGTYTDEQAQDAVGTILVDTSTIDLTYNDGTPSITAAIVSSAPLPGSPTTTTQSAADNSTKVATTAYADNAVAKQAEVLIIAVSDETTVITTGTAKVTFRMPFAMTVTAVRASVNTVSSSGLPTVDINESGTTILSTKLTIDASEFTSTTAATPAVISDASLADDAEITIDIDVAGTGAKGLKVCLIGTRT